MMWSTFAPYGTNQPLHVRILPWGTRCANHFLHPQAFRHGDPVTAVDRIAVAQKISARVDPWKRFPHLLHRPLLAGVFGHLKVQHTTPSIGQHHEHKQNQCLATIPIFGRITKLDCVSHWPLPVSNCSDVTLAEALGFLFYAIVLPSPRLAPRESGSSTTARRFQTKASAATIWCC